MSKFRKKPVVIEAEQWHGPESVIAGVRQATLAEKQAHLWIFAHGYELYVIETLEGLHWVRPGDWIITGVKGEKYPCKPDIFAATYEPVEDP